MRFRKYFDVTLQSIVYVYSSVGKKTRAFIRNNIITPSLPTRVQYVCEGVGYTMGSLTRFNGGPGRRLVKNRNRPDRAVARTRYTRTWSLHRHRINPNP